MFAPPAQGLFYLILFYGFALTRYLL